MFVFKLKTRVCKVFSFHSLPSPVHFQSCDGADPWRHQPVAVAVAHRRLLGVEAGVRGQVKLADVLQEQKKGEKARLDLNTLDKRRRFIS